MSLSLVKEKSHEETKNTSSAQLLKKTQPDQSVNCPPVSHGPLIFWLYPVFGIRAPVGFWETSEWLFCVLLFSGFWNKKLGVLGGIGACFVFISTISIIPFLPDAWAKSAGGFPAMTDMVAFLMKDIGLLALSLYLLRQDVIRVSAASGRFSGAVIAPLQPSTGSAREGKVA